MIIKLLFFWTGFAVAAFVFAALSVYLARRPIIVVYGLLAVHAWQLLAPLPSAQIAGVGLGLLDATNMLAAGAAVLRMRVPRGLQWPLLLVVAMVAVAVVRAVLTFGTSGALLGFRAELYFILPAIFASTLKPRQIVAALNAVWHVGLGLAVLAIFRWLLLSVGIDILPSANTGYAVQRVINAGATLMVAAAAMIGVWRWLHHRPMHWHGPVITAGLLAVVLLAQHRSVWVATAVMLAILFVGTRARFWARAGVVVALVGAIAFVELFQIGQDSAVSESLAQATSNTSTWTWRLERWANVWDTHAARGPLAVLFGSGYGHAWVSGAVGVWEVSPHNGYIQIAVRLGLFGALLLYGSYAVILMRLGREFNAHSRILRIVTVGALVYFIPYAGDMFSGLLLGLAVSQTMIGARTGNPAGAQRRRHHGATAAQLPR